MSPEMDTLDQLLGSEMPLHVIRQVYADATRFECGMMGLLQSGDIQLFSEDESELPHYLWRAILNDPAKWRASYVRLTSSGAMRVD